MPAIRRDILKKDAEAVIEKFSNPHLFIRRLKAFYSSYADRTKRPGHAVIPPPLIPAFNISAPVERELFRALALPIQESFEHTLMITDMLWAQEYFEIKKLAIQILGSLAPEDPEPMIARNKDWAENNEEERLYELLFETGTRSLREYYLDEWLEILRIWVRSDHHTHQILGLRALIPVINDPSFDNLPVIFRYLTPMSYSVPPIIKVYFRDVCLALSRKSPFETAYFLEKGLANSTNSTLGWISRQIMDSLPENVRHKMRAASKHNR